MEYLPTFALIYPKNGPNVGKYSIHGASGIYTTMFYGWDTWKFPQMGAPMAGWFLLYLLWKIPSLEMDRNG